MYTFTKSTYNHNSKYRSRLKNARPQRYEKQRKRHGFNTPASKWNFPTARLNFPTFLFGNG